MDNCEFVKNFLRDPLSKLAFGQIQQHRNVIIIPLLNIRSLDFITVKRAQSQGNVEINETGSVGTLKVENRGAENVLIPFGVTVKGGKQDRTVYEPILIPTEWEQDIDLNSSRQRPISISQTRPRSTFSTRSKVTLNVPTRCVERSRWSMQSSKFQVCSMISPSVAYHASSKGGQSAVWSTINSMKSSMNVGNKAPTSSFNDIARSRRKDIKEFLPHFPAVSGQCGVAVFINNELIAVEFYGNTEAWKDMHEESVKAFILEALWLSDEEFQILDLSGYHDKIIETLPQILSVLSNRIGRGLGDIVDIETEDHTWRGVTLIHQDTFAQFYLIRRSMRTQPAIITRTTIAPQIRIGSRNRDHPTKQPPTPVTIGFPWRVGDPPLPPRPRIGDPFLPPRPHIGDPPKDLEYKIRRWVTQIGRRTNDDTVWKTSKTNDSPIFKRSTTASSKSAQFHRKY